MFITRLPIELPLLSTAAASHDDDDDDTVENADNILIFNFRAGTS